MLPRQKLTVVDKHLDNACAVNIKCLAKDGNCDKEEIYFHNSENSVVKYMLYGDYKSMKNGMHYKPAQPTCQNLDSEHGNTNPLFSMKNGNKCNRRGVTTTDNLQVDFFSGGGGAWNFEMCNFNKLNSEIVNLSQATPFINLKPP